MSPLTTIKKILRYRIKNKNKIFSTVMKDSENHSFISNGYYVVKWKKEDSIISSFPQTSYENSFKIPEYETKKTIVPSKRDIKILKNIKKIKEEFSKKNLAPIVILFNKIFDLNLISNPLKVLKSYGSKKLSFYSDPEETDYPVWIENDNIELILLPIQWKAPSNGAYNAEEVELRTKEVLSLLGFIG